MPAPHPPEFRRRGVDLARLDEHPIAQTAKDGRPGSNEDIAALGSVLFPGERSEELPKNTYMRAWRAARRTAFVPDVTAGPLGATA